MVRAVNDATRNKAGDVYQYYIALKDCFELNDGDTLQIETNGDVSIINAAGGVFQKEVKHHFGNKNLSDRDIDFWKTLANWYIDYDRVKDFSHFILSTTATVQDDSLFFNWNNIDKEEKLERLNSIGAIIKEKEKTFRNQYNKIFGDSYDKKRLLNILEKFTIEAAKTQISGISSEFSKYIRSIPEENRDGYIDALLGRIEGKIAVPPHEWRVTKTEFDEFCQIEAIAYGMKNYIPLPRQYAASTIPKEKSEELQSKRFVEAIKEIEYFSEISGAISDYWKTNLTIVKYFYDNCMYLDSLRPYREELEQKLNRQKRISERHAKGLSLDKKLDESQMLYDTVMMWEAVPFGSIIHNQGFFQRGVVHTIVDETDFKWKVGEEKNEYK